MADRYHGEHDRKMGWHHGEKNHTFIFASGDTQVSVEVWSDGIDVKVRPDPSAIWGLPLEPVSDEGDPVQFAFEEEEA